MCPSLSYLPRQLLSRSMLFLLLSCGVDSPVGFLHEEIQKDNRLKSSVSLSSFIFSFNQLSAFITHIFSFHGLFKHVKLHY